MTEYQRARQWRIRHDLTVDALAELTGYSREAVYLFERGVTAPTSRRKSTRIDPFVWQRYKMACHGVEAQLQTKKQFNW